MEIAKFRAARWLWAEIVAAYKPACECACKMVAHAQTSEWNMTVYDAHVTASFSNLRLCLPLLPA